MTSGQATILFLVVCANSVALFWAIYMIRLLNTAVERMDKRTELHTQGLIKLVKWRESVIGQKPIPQRHEGTKKTAADNGIPLIGHTIIVGQSGSGKSNLIMGDIVRRLEAGQQLHIVDVKKELGPIFRKHCTIVTVEDAVSKMNELLEQATIRQDLFAAASEQYSKLCRDVTEYAQLTGNQLSTIVLVLEELVMLTDQIPQDKLIQLLVTGRSAGIYVVALAQYLNKDVLERKGSINFNTRVFLGKWDNITTGILFGSVDSPTKNRLSGFVGEPGKGIVERDGKFITRLFERMDNEQLEKYL